MELAQDLLVSGKTKQLFQANFDLSVICLQLCSEFVTRGSSRTSSVNGSVFRVIYSWYKCLKVTEMVLVGKFISSY